MHNMIVLGVGSNLGDRLDNLRSALNAIKKIANLRVISCAPVYVSDALLPESAAQSWNIPYLNTAVSCETSLQPERLLGELKRIERELGRDEKRERWCPRVIDIDILAWDDKKVDLPGLTIPHKDLCARPFALWPLADLCPNWKCPVSGDWHNVSAKEIVLRWGPRHDGRAPYHTRQIQQRIDCPQIVGILNVTPDSFSDGGKFYAEEDAIQQTRQLFAAGADVIDIGAESTRPGAEPISAEEEWRRLKPILSRITKIWQGSSFKPKISVDTRRPQVAERVIAAGVDWVNDVSGFSDPAMQEIARCSNVKLVFMHSFSIPEQRDIGIAQNENVVEGVLDWLQKKALMFDRLGIVKERLIFDPGVGFGKNAAQSLTLLRQISRLTQAEFPLLVGHSRKSFMGLFTANAFAARDVETNVVSQYLAAAGVDYLRVHNVDWLMRAMKVTQALKTGDSVGVAPCAYPQRRGNLQRLN